MSDDMQTVQVTLRMTPYQMMEMRDRYAKVEEGVYPNDEFPITNVIWQMARQVPDYVNLHEGMMYSYLNDSVPSRKHTYRVVALDDTNDRVCIRRLHDNMGGPAGGLLLEPQAKVVQDIQAGKARVL